MRSTTPLIILSLFLFANLFTPALSFYGQPIPITVGTYNSYGQVPVDFFRISPPSSDVVLPKQNGPKMILALYTSQSLISTGNTCFSTNSGEYDHLFTPSASTGETFDFLTLTAEGKPASGIITLDYQNWRLYPFGNNLLKPDSCTNSIPGYELDSYGILGLGFEGSSIFSYRNGQNSTFAIYPDQYTNLSLIFNPDTDAKLTGPLSTTFKTDSNWQIQGVLKYQWNITGQASQTTTAYRAIFDVNSRFIGLPSEIHSNLLKLLLSSGIATCTYTNPNNYTECTFYNDNAVFPSLSFTFGTQNINILPQQLNISQTGRVIKLAFVPMSSSADPVFTNVNSAYLDCIILGTPFLNSYFTLFNAATSTISLYQPSKPYQAPILDNSGPYVTPTSSKIISAAIAGIIVLVALLMCLKLKYDHNKMLQESKEGLPMTEGFMSVSNQ